MNYRQFKLSYFLNGAEKCHIARVNITSNQDLSLHSHDFAEMLWIEKGSGIHQINGQSVRVQSGDLFMIRPDDYHTFSPRGEGLTILNIAFSQETLDYLYQRYFPDSTGYFWSTARLPFQARLSIDIQRRISARAEEAMKYQRSNLQLDSLLLFIFRQITANEIVPYYEEMPFWLFNAIQGFCGTEMLAAGIQGFVLLCDRNVDYVNRMVQMHLGKSLSETVNDFRLQYATTQLSLTNMPIKEICSNCGFKNMGYFYRIFKAKYNQTPREYRSVNQKIV